LQEGQIMIEGWLDVSYPQIILHVSTRQQAISVPSASKRPAQDVIFQALAKLMRISPS
jgi:hypothetical protein